MVEVPSMAISPAVIGMVIWVELANVTAFDAPLKVAVVFAIKFVPLMVNVNAPPPALADAGENVAMVGTGLLTVCERAAEVLALKFVSPLYVAVIECVAADSALVEYVATPLVMVLVAKAAAPSKKVTVPDGVPTPDVVVAVKVTEVPNIDGFNEEPSAMATFALLTVCERAAEVLALKVASPL